MRKLVLRLIMDAVLGLIALIPAAAFYVLMGWVVGLTITWPVIAAVWWVEASILQNDAKRDGMYEL